MLRAIDRLTGYNRPETAELVEAVRALDRPLTDSDDLDPLMERIGDARYVLLGEASHGTAVYYTWATRLVPTSCEHEVVAMLAEVQRQPSEYRQPGREAHFNAEQNALVAKNAEQYYRTMVRGGAASWNIRDHHMMETLERLMQH